MFKLKSVAAQFVIACAVVVTAPAAFAQDVLILDTARVIKESKAGQDMATKVQTIGATMQSELAPEQDALKTEKATLDTRVQGKTREQIGQDPALVAQLEAYGRKLQTNAAKTDRRARELVATENNALFTFKGKMDEAVEKVRARRNGKIILAKASTFANVAEVEITDEVITQLDQDSPTIVVNRVTLPPPQAQQ